MSQTMKAGQVQGDWELDEGVRRLEPVERMDGRAAVAGGLFAVGAMALAVVGSDPGLLSASAAGVAVAALGGASNRRGVKRQELHDHLTEQVCPVLGLSVPSRKAVQLSGWSEGFVGEPVKVTLVYPARVIPDAIWTGKVTAVVENSLGGRYRVKSLQERKHRLELERFEPEQAPQEEQAISRTRQVVGELLGESAQVKIELDNEGEPARIQVSHDQGNAMVMANRRQRVQRILATRIPGEWQARWDLQQDTVEFFIRTPMPTLVFPPEEHSSTAVAHEAYQDFQVPLCGGRPSGGGWRFVAAGIGWPIPLVHHVAHENKDM